MNCPKCGHRFVPMPTEDGTLFGCPECGGLWLERRTLIGLVRRAASKAGVTQRSIGLIETPAEPGGRDCPSCSEFRLDVLTMRSVQVERCAECGGIFLDRGELQLIAERLIDAQLQWKDEEGKWVRLSHGMRIPPEVGWVAAEVALLVAVPFLE